MTTKRVRLNKNVHEKLLYLKKQTNAKSLNDVISSLISNNEEFYLNDGSINLKDKKVIFRYNNGQLISIKVQK